MPRRAVDPIAQLIAQQKEAREQRSEAYKEFSGEREYNLNEAKFGHQQAHDAATLSLDKLRTTADTTSKYMSMAKEMYDLKQNTQRAADVGHFYNLLSKVDRNAPDAADVVGKLKAAFPQAMQDEGVRATLSNDWSDVLSQRGLSRADREAAQKRDFIMKFSAASAKDDEFGTNNPELKAVHDMYAKDLLQYEAGKRAAAGVPATPTPQPLSAASFFAPQPSKPTGAAPTVGSSVAAPAAAPPAQAAPTATPVENPVSAAPPAAAGAPEVPPASTPKEEQIGDWANTRVAEDGLDVNLPENPTAGDIYKVLSSTPPPTPPPEPSPKEQAV